MYQIAKRFNFSAAHRLMGLPCLHPCSRLHGHNYLVEVCCRSEDLDSRGFAHLDYRDLVGFDFWLEQNWDHRTILHNDDPLVELLYQHDPRHVITMDYNPTAENLAMIFYRQAKVTCPWISSVRVSETPETWAEFAGAETDEVLIGYPNQSLDTIVGHG